MRKSVFSILQTLVGPYSKPLLNSPSTAFQSNDDRSNKSEANRAVIVGGSVGGSLFVVLIAILLVVYMRNRR